MHWNSSAVVPEGMRDWVVLPLLRWKNHLGPVFHAQPPNLILTILNVRRSHCAYQYHIHSAKPRLMLFYNEFISYIVRHLKFRFNTKLRFRFGGWLDSRKPVLDWPRQRGHNGQSADRKIFHDPTQRYRQPSVHRRPSAKWVRNFL